MATLGAEEFTELVTATLRKVESELYDNVTLKHPLLELLRSEQKSETGRAMVLPLELGLNNSTTLTDTSGSFANTKSADILGSAQYKWSAPIVSHVRLIWQDLQENQGSQAQINLLKTHLKNMEYSHSRELVKFLHARVKDIPVGAARGASNGFDNTAARGGRFHSLDQLVSNDAYDDNPTNAAAGSETPFTVGGIDADVQPLWQGHRLEFPLDGTLTIRQVFRKVENEVLVDTSNKNAITHIICGRDVFEEFVDSFDDKVRYTEFSNGQAKFRQVEFGDLIVRLDPDCPVKRAYFIDKSTLHMRNLAGNFMKPQKAQFIPGTLDVVHPVASVIAVGVNERRANAVLLRPATAGGDA